MRLAKKPQLYRASLPKSAAVPIKKIKFRRRSKGTDLHDRGNCRQYKKADWQSRIKDIKLADFIVVRSGGGKFCLCICKIIRIAVFYRCPTLRSHISPSGKMCCHMSFVVQIIDPQTDRKSDEIKCEYAEKYTPERQLGARRLADIEPERFEFIDIDPWNPSQHKDCAGGDRDISSIFLRALLENICSHSGIGPQPRNLCQ